MNIRRIAPLALMLGAFLVDRLSKWWVAGFLDAQGETRINALLTLRETYNEGIAFGLFQGIGPVVGWLTVGVLAALLFYLLQAPSGAWALRFGLALIVGGAAGNLIDRITVGRVLDFIETPLRQ